jgi:ABC-type transporter Mla maintaining outer membrane lipid asymmetry ATPase subunit MlaF
VSIPETRRYRREPEPPAKPAPKPPPGTRGGTEVVLDRVTKRGGDGRAILSSVSFEVKPGEHVAVIGSGGSGKTTLLQLVAVVDLPNEGAVLIDGVSTACLDYFDVRERRTRTGYVFQGQGLLSNTTIFDNVALPLRYHLGATLDEAAIAARVRALLGELEIEAAAALPPQRASASVRKRALVARALALEPSLLILDEPQENLVPTEQELVRRACESRREARGLTILQADHDGEFGPLWPDRVILLESGVLKAIGAAGEIKA